MSLNTIKVFCEFCGDGFQDLSDVAEHTKIRHLDLLRCSKCGKEGLSSALLIYQHLIICRDKEVPEICQIDTPDNKFYCSKCGKEFKTITNHFDHVKFLHENDSILAKNSKILDIIFCDRCGVGLKSYIELYNHFKLKHRKGHQCLICFREFFKSSEDLYFHYTQTHESNKVKQVERLWQESHIGNISRLYYCNKCGKGFYKVIDHFHHIKLVHKNEFLLCCVCDFLTEDYDSLLNHYAAHFSWSSRVTCRVCNSFFSSVSLYNTHRREHPEKVSFPCNLCTFQDKREKTVHRHWMRSHFDKFLDTFQCDFCDVMIHPHQYKTHQSKHKTECKKCDIELCSAYLQQHIQENHPSNALSITSAVIGSSTATETNVSVVIRESKEVKENIVKSVSQPIPDLTDTQSNNALEKQEKPKLMHERCLEAFRLEDKIELEKAKTTKEAVVNTDNNEFSINPKNTAKTGVGASENPVIFQAEAKQQVNKSGVELTRSDDRHVEVLEKKNAPIVISDDEDLQSSDNSRVSAIESSKVSKTGIKSTPYDSIKIKNSAGQVGAACKRSTVRQRRGAKRRAEHTETKTTTVIPSVDCETSSPRLLDSVYRSDKAVNLEKLETTKDVLTTQDQFSNVRSTEICRSATESALEIKGIQPADKSKEKRKFLAADYSDVEILKSTTAFIIISDDEDLNEAKKLSDKNLDSSTSTTNRLSTSENLGNRNSFTISRTRKSRSEKRDKKALQALFETTQAILISEGKRRRSNTVTSSSVNSRSTYSRLTASVSKKNSIASEEDNINNSLEINASQSTKPASQKARTDCKAINFGIRQELYTLFEETQDNTYSPIKCEECKKLFLNSTDLGAHRQKSRQKHAKGKYGCDMCGKILLDINKDSILEHIYLHEILASGQRADHKCIYCHTTFERKSDVAKHEYAIHSKRPKRTIKDWDDFITMEYRIFEKVAKGEMEEPLWCMQCDAYFETKEDLISHKESTKHGSFAKCKICNYKNSNIAIMENHIERHMNSDEHFKDVVLRSKSPKASNSATQCESCKRNFMTNKDLRFHILVFGLHDIQKYTCDICQKTFSTDLSFVIHIREHANVQNNRTTCRYCSKKFQMHSFLAAHESKFHPTSMADLDLTPYFSEEFKALSNNHNNKKRIWCPECYRYFKREQLLIRHQQETKHGQTKLCTRCNFEFLNDEKYRIHLKVHKLKNSGRQKCIYCNFTIKNRWLLADHEVRNHEYLSTPNQESNNDIRTKVKENVTKEKREKNLVAILDGPARCKQCERLYMSEQDLKFHCSKIRSRKHFVNKYSCDVCSRMFDTETKLYVELARHEIEKNPRDECLYCRKSIKDYEGLALHETSSHNKKPNIENIDLFLSNEFKNLQKILEGEAAEVYWCPECDEHFEKIDSLMNHKDVLKHGVMNRCKICDRLYYDQRKFEVHTVHHDIENSGRVKCKVCKVVIKEKMSLARHEVHNHQNNKEKLSPDLNITQKSSGGSNENVRVSPDRQLEIETQTGKESDKINKTDLQVKNQKRDRIILNTKDNRVTDVGDDSLEEGEIVDDYDTESGLPAEVNSYVQCTYCPKRFLHENDMIAHCELNRRHNMPKYECNNCKKQFNTELLFKIHMSNYDIMASGRSACNECGDRFYDLAKHEYTRHNIKPRFDKNLNLFKSEQVILWESQGLDKFIWCPGCEAHFDNSTDLVLHKTETSHGMSHQCTICSKTYYKKEMLDIHVLEHEILKTNRMRCGKCSDEYEASWELAKHELLSHEELQDDVSNTKSKSDKDKESKKILFDKHKNKISVPCGETNLVENPKEPNTKRISNEHMTQEERNQNKSDSLKSKHISHNKSLLTTAKTSEVVLNRGNVEPPPRQKYEIISKKSKKIVFDKHKNKLSRQAGATNLVENPKERNIKRISNEHATQEERNQSKSNSLKSKHSSHNKRLLTGAKSSDVVLNKGNIEAQPQPKYEIINSEAFCDCCVNRYVSASDAEIHIKIVNPTPDQYTCRICYLKFTQDILLRRHLYEHVLIVNNVTCCCVCQRRYRNKQYQAIHEYAHHSRRMDYISTFNIDNVLKKLRGRMNVDMTPLLSKPYSCPYCNCTFPTSEDVLRHKETSCLSVTCQICKAPLKGKAQFDMHMIQHDILAKKRMCCLQCGYKNTNTFILATHEHSHTLNVDTVDEVCDENSEPLQKRMRLSEDLSHPQQSLLVYNPLHQFSPPLASPYIPGLFVHPNFQVPFVPEYGYTQTPVSLLGSQCVEPLLKPPYVSEDLSPSTYAILNNLHNFKQILLANLRNTGNLKNRSVHKKTGVSTEEVSVPESSSENMPENITHSCDNKTTETNEPSEHFSNDNDTIEASYTIETNDTIEANQTSEVIELQQTNTTVDDIGSSDLTENLEEPGSTLDVTIDLKESNPTVAIQNPQPYLILRQDLAIDPFKSSNDTEITEAITVRDPVIENTQEIEDQPTTLRCNPPRILLVNNSKENIISSVTPPSVTQGKADGTGLYPALGTSLESAASRPRIEGDAMTENRKVDQAETGKRKASSDRLNSKFRRERCSSRDRSSTSRESQKSREREVRTSQSHSKRRLHRERSESKNMKTESEDLENDGKKRTTVRTDKEKSSIPRRENSESRERNNGNTEYSQPNSYDATTHMPKEDNLDAPLPTVTSSLNDPTSTEYEIITKPEDIDICDETKRELFYDFEYASTSVEATSITARQESYAAHETPFNENESKPFHMLRECYACGKVFIKDAIDSHECSGPF